MKKCLIIFTSTFPFGKGETFLEHEIPIISKFFNVTVVPMRKDESTRELPKEVMLDTELAEVFDKFLKTRYFNYLKTVLKYKNLMLFMEEITFRKHFSPKAIPYLFWKDEFLKWWRRTMHRYDDCSFVIFYSYWLSLSAFSIGAIKETFGKDSRYPVVAISRAHGVDLYEYRHKGNYIPFRRAILERLDKVFAVSKDGAEYLKSRYREFAEKIEVARLGVPKQDVLNKSSDDDVFRILSVSTITPVKRLHLIVEALNELSKRYDGKRIFWTHIGDGYEREKIQGMASKMLQGKVNYRFLGWLSNKEVLSYYRNNPVDLFINVSYSEGLPVSIMEAMSFGVPVVATDVGGTSELVDNSCGRIMPRDIKPSEIAEIILEIINLKKKAPDEYMKLRENSLRRWDELANAERNFEEFSKKLQSLTISNFGGKAS